MSDQFSLDLEPEKLPVKFASTSLTFKQVNLGQHTWGYVVVRLHPDGLVIEPHESHANGKFLLAQTPEQLWTDLQLILTAAKKERDFEMERRAKIDQANINKSPTNKINLTLEELLK